MKHNLILATKTQRHEGTRRKPLCSFVPLCLCGYLLLTILVLTSCKNPHSIIDHLPYYSGADFTPQWMDKKASDTVHIIPDFSFTNQDGHTITRKDFDGKITVVDFFFTTCPGICRQLTTGLMHVQAAYRNDPAVLLLSHSVTPEHDSVQVLKEYAKEHDAIPGKWHFVTGDRKSIYRIARTAYFADEDMGWKKDSTTFLHTENILLIDKHHHIRGVYKGTISLQINELISDIEELETEE